MTEFRPANFPILPIVIKNLLIINVLFFLAQLTANASGFNLEGLLGLHHVRSPLFQPWQIITHLFLHGGFWHLAANMFALWMFGAVLENLWGAKKFLTFYFLCGIGAALIQLAWLWFDNRDIVNQFLALKVNPTPEGVRAFLNQVGLDSSRDSIFQHYQADPDNGMSKSMIVEYITRITNTILSNPTIGASGAVFGILAAFVYLFPNTEIYLYFLFPVKAKWIGLAYFAYEFFAGFQNKGGDNIAHWAHIGGGLVGFLLVLMWNKKNPRTFY
jgi:membrane associated rhomboid family serine protease